MDLDSSTTPLPPPDDSNSKVHARPQSDTHETLVNGRSTVAVTPDRRLRKSLSTCSTCRFRKVRCNGAHPICASCKRLGFPCSYDEHDIDASSLTLPRRRVKQACLSCHSRKARCSGHLPSCERCRSHGIDCVYRPSKRARIGPRASRDLRSSVSHDEDTDRECGRDADYLRYRERDFDRTGGRHDSPASTDAASAATPGSNNYDVPFSDETFESLIGRTFDQFFRHVHHVPAFSFLHRASLMEQYHAGKVDKSLLLALVGITSCLTDMGPGMSQYGERCIHDAEALLLADYARPSTFKLQALVFIIKHRMLSSKFSNAFVLMSIASRFASALRLNYDAPNLCFLAQESRRRLMWALYCIDSGISGGYRDFALWRAGDIRISLPCNERNFEFDLPQVTEKLIPSLCEPRSPQMEDTGSLALHIRILHIHHKIMEFTKSVLVERNIDTKGFQNQVLALDAELKDFANHLPTSFQFSDNSLRLRAYSPRICVFIMIHVWWRQCHCDLFRLALTGFREALPQSTLELFDQSFLDLCLQRCVEHCLAMTGIFSAMQKLNAKMVADLDLATCAYQCARMLKGLFHLGDVAKRFGLTSDLVAEYADICQRTIKLYCMGPAANTVRSDLEKLIKDGLDTRTPMIYPGHLGPNGTISGTSGVPLSQHPVLDNLDVSDEPNTLRAGNSNPPFTPTVRGTLASVSALQPSTLLGIHASENRLSQRVVHGTPNTGSTLERDETEDRPVHSQFALSEVNSAYEGAFDGLGLDNGLDHALGFEFDEWTSSGNWIGTDFTNNSTMV